MSLVVLSPHFCVEVESDLPSEVLIRVHMRLCGCRKPIFEVRALLGIDINFFTLTRARHNTLSHPRLAQAVLSNANRTAG